MDCLVQMEYRSLDLTVGLDSTISDILSRRTS